MVTALTFPDNWRAIYRRSVQAGYDDEDLATAAAIKTPLLLVLAALRVVRAGTGPGLGNSGAVASRSLPARCRLVTAACYWR